MLLSLFKQLRRSLKSASSLFDSISLKEVSLSALLQLNLELRHSLCQRRHSTCKLLSRLHLLKDQTKLNIYPSQSCRDSLLIHLTL